MLLELPRNTDRRVRRHAVPYGDDARPERILQVREGGRLAHGPRDHDVYACGLECVGSVVRAGLMEGEAVRDVGLRVRRKGREVVLVWGGHDWVLLLREWLRWDVNMLGWN
jgi:hypothetical protein